MDKMHEGYVLEGYYPYYTEQPNKVVWLGIFFKASSGI